MQVVLVMFRAEGERRSFSVAKDVTVIGRREDCDLRIPVSEVSRKHCRILKDDEGLRVEDLGSSNGTFHNGQRVSGSIDLQPGDSIQVGPVVFVLQVDGNPPDDELAPFQERAAHHLDDSAGAAPPEFDGADANTAGENLELLEDSMAAAAPTVAASPEDSAAPLPMAESAGPIELDLSDEDHTAQHDGGGALSEDELLMDLNAPAEKRDKH